MKRSIAELLFCALIAGAFLACGEGVEQENSGSLSIRVSNLSAAEITSIAVMLHNGLDAVANFELTKSDSGWIGRQSDIPAGKYGVDVVAFSGEREVWMGSGNVEIAPEKTAEIRFTIPEDVDEEHRSLNIDSLALSQDSVKPGDKVIITARISGGKAPYEISGDFSEEDKERGDLAYVGRFEDGRVDGETGSIVWISGLKGGGHRDLIITVTDSSKSSASATARIRVEEETDEKTGAVEVNLDFLKAPDIVVTSNITRDEKETSGTLRFEIKDAAGDKGNRIEWTWSSPDCRVLWSSPDQLKPEEKISGNMQGAGGGATVRFSVENDGGACDLMIHAENSGKASRTLTLNVSTAYVPPTAGGDSERL